MTTTADHWFNLEGRITAADIRHLARHGHIDKLSLVNKPRLTARIAQGFSRLQAVDWLWLWCDVTRTAMRDVIRIPGLRTLDVLAFSKPGRLPPFAAASGLKVFRGNHDMSEDDLLQVCTCKSLQQLGAQGAALSPEAIRAILDLPELTTLDLESSPFDDAMAEQLSVSTSITALEVGATRLTGAGLRQLCRMRQLRSLDLWSLPIRESDLAQLALLPDLEYLSVGDVADQPSFDAQTLLTTLESIPSLNRLWLDGVQLTPAQQAQLQSRYASVRIT